jgi:hypothetical protein
MDSDSGLHQSHPRVEVRRRDILPANPTIARVRFYGNDASSGEKRVPIANRKACISSQVNNASSVGDAVLNKAILFAMKNFFTDQPIGRAQPQVKRGLFAADSNAHDCIARG